MPEEEIKSWDLPWVKEFKQKQNEERKQYENEMQQPYFEINKKPTFREWQQQKRQKQMNQGEVRQGEKTNKVVNAINQYVREAKYDAAKGNVPKAKYTFPLAGIAALGGYGFATAPATFVASTGGGYLGGKATDFGTKLVTGKSWAQNVHDMTGLDKEIAEMTNPGIAYGGWVGNNFRHLGRYTLNYMNPRGYGNYIARLKDVYTKPFYTKPPTFHNGKKPKWYTNSFDDEMRFQNGAKWAGISEEEVPQPYILKNADGQTYRFAKPPVEKTSWEYRGDVVDQLDLDKQDVINKALRRQIEGKAGVRNQDLITTVGGVHSDYNVLVDNPKAVLWEYNDVQKLNPQYQISDWIKEHILRVPSETKVKWLDWWAGKDIGKYLLGYKPFEYRQGIGVAKLGGQRIYFDPTEYKSTGIIKPDFGAFVSKSGRIIYPTE